MSSQIRGTYACGKTYFADGEDAVKCYKAELEARVRSYVLAEQFEKMLVLT